jgi:hypothetical protein
LAKDLDGVSDEALAAGLNLLARDVFRGETFERLSTGLHPFDPFMDPKADVGRAHRRRSVPFLLFGGLSAMQCNIRDKEQVIRITVARDEAGVDL